ncbi:MAG: tetratricopeptide repeat protein [Bacteroidaceae bacterium]|nr:tetratricopeptide repeat protein [Bacteroidaceae bacterium]
MIDAKTLRLITQNGLQNFAAGHILDGIAALRTLLPHCAAETIICAEADSLEENYHHMLSFLRGGGNDEKRSEVQEKIQRQGISLLEQASRAIRITQNKGRYCEALKTVSLETDILETDERQDDIFDMLWTSPLWTSQDTALWYDFILRQRDMVQQNLTGALFLSLWEHYDAEKMQLLNILADSECHRTHIAAVTYLLLLRLRHKELVSLMPPLPDKLLSRKGRQLIAQVEYEFLLMLVSEKDMEMELKEAETLTNELLSGKQSLNINNIKGIVALKGRYLRNRLQRGLDINLSKLPLLHNCEYMRRISHWFQPFDKTHPLFQSVMIDEKGNEKHNLSMLVDLIMDCDVDKLATLYLAAHDKDFSKALQQLEDQELPDIENAVIPEYSFRFIMQDLYRFFVHSPLHSQLINPFRGEETLLDFPELATLFSAEDSISCCKLLFELGRYKQVLSILDNVINREGASVSALLLKGEVLKKQKKYGEAINQVRSAEMLEPENEDILRFLIECYAWLGRHEEELEYLQKLAEVVPDNKSLPLLIANAMDKIGRREEALSLFFKLDYEASQDDENYDKLVSSIANTALSLDKLDIAERYTKKELDLSDGKKWEPHLRMGHIRLLQNDWKSAIDSYEQFVNNFVEQLVPEANIALAKLRDSWEMLIRKGLKKEDLLLIHDILQAATDNASRQDSSQPKEE